MYAQKILAYIERHRGRFAKGEDGSLHVVVEGRRIPLDACQRNYEFKKLIIAAAGVSTVTPGARAAIERLQAAALSKADALLVRKFSAMGRECLYVPISNGELLRIAAGGITKTANGENADQLWVEHPYDSPLVWTPGPPAPALVAFERLLVDKQTAAVPAMKWLVAMHCGLLPFVRDACTARALLQIRGHSGSGKSTTCERFTRLLGLGSILGDITEASVSNLGDIGLLALDNKEHANLNQGIIDYLLFLATGAKRLRSHLDGSMRQAPKGRAIAAITSIEGAFKAELLRRLLTVECFLSKTITRDVQEETEGEIERRRHEIGSALMQVLSRWLAVQAEHRLVPDALPDFVSYFHCLANLLRAFGQVVERPEEWAEGLIGEWAEVIGGQEIEASELEHPLRRVLKEGFLDEFSTERITYRGRSGILYATDTGDLLTALQKLGVIGLPRTVQGLSRRLHSNTFLSLTVLDDRRAPEVLSLRRTTTKRPIGVFVYDDDDTLPGDNRHRQSSYTEVPPSQEDTLQ